jgi:hypothetical protein
LGRIRPYVVFVALRGAIVKQTYRALAGLVALGVLIQAASIAFGWFGVISDLESGAVFDVNSEGNAGHAIHAIAGMIGIPVIGLILLIVSFFVNKEVPGALKWAGIVFGLTVLQVVLAFVAFGLPIIGALHGINALFMFGAAARAAALIRTPAVARTDATGTSVPV